MSGFFESRPGMVIGTIGFSAALVAGLLWFVHDTVQLAEGIFQEQAVIDFDKGAMYMLGGGMIIAALLVAVIPKAFFNRDLSEGSTSIVGKGLLIGFVVMLALPQLVHLGVWATLKSRNYVVCQDLGSRWLMHVTFVYASSPERCMEELMSRR